VTSGKPCQAIVVGTSSGSGIFLVPAEMMQQAVWLGVLVYLAWIVGGVLSLAGAITYAELGAMSRKPAANTFTSATPTDRSRISLRWTWFAIAKPLRLQP